MTTLSEIRDAAEDGREKAFFSHVSLPPSMRAAFIRREDVERYARLPRDQKDPRKTVHVGEVPIPPLGPGEALVAVMASSINHNIVWTTLFEPVPTFTHLDHFARGSKAAARHALDYHIFGTDAAGVIVALGPGECDFSVGDEVTVNSVWTLGGRSASRDDMMADTVSLGWGYETNFGGFAELCLAQTSQLMPKPRHLTWEEAASMPAVSGTCYRMLVGDRGARMKQGDVVLIWGAAGGLGLTATQYVLNGGGIPVAVVSTPAKAQLMRRFGVTCVIDRVAEGFSFWKDPQTPDMKELRRFRERVKELAGDDPDIVFEHSGKETFAASLYVARRGGSIVTCGSSSGYNHVYDNRQLWLGVKNIIGSHVATHYESRQANRLACRGSIHPTVSHTIALDQLGDAAAAVARNEHAGKIGVLCLARAPGGGVRDAELRARLLPQLQRCAGAGRAA